MATKDKYERFQRIAPERKSHVLECLQALGCCSDPASYAYEAEALPPIFQEIVVKLAEVWHRLNHHSPYPFIPFRLGQSEILEINSHSCRFADMATMSEVMDLLHENGASFTALEPIRERYTEQFGSDLCWTYPFCTSNGLGCILLPVQEGILYLPYTGLDRETYEQIDTGAAALLTGTKALELQETLLTRTGDLYCILADMRRSLPDSEAAGASSLRDMK